MTARKRILIALSYYHPYISGVSEYARQLAELLSVDHDVTVLTGQHDAALSRSELVNGVQVLRARANVFMHKGYLSSELPHLFRRLARHSDAVNIHLPMFEAGVLARLVPRGTPLVSTFHCDLQPTGGVLDGIAVAVANFSSRECVRRSRTVFTTSLDYASGSPILKGVDCVVEGFAPVKERIAIQQGPEEREDRRFTVGFLGRFVEEKGIDVLLDAAEKVVASHPDIRFIIAGDYQSVAGGSVHGRLKHKLDRLAGHVSTPGSLDESLLPKFYRSLDVFVLPSVNAYEAFGMVQVEAMLAGNRVIASDMRGVRVPIVKTGCGTLVEPRNAQALADAIIQMYESRAGHSRERVRKLAQSVFSNEQFKQRYVEALLG